MRITSISPFIIGVFICCISVETSAEVIYGVGFGVGLTPINIHADIYEEIDVFSKKDQSIFSFHGNFTILQKKKLGNYLQRGVVFAMQLQESSSFLLNDFLDTRQEINLSVYFVQHFFLVERFSIHAGAGIGLIIRHTEKSTVVGNILSLPSNPKISDIETSDSKVTIDTIPLLQANLGLNLVMNRRFYLSLEGILRINMYDFDTTQQISSLFGHSTAQITFTSFLGKL